MTTDKGAAPSSAALPTLGILLALGSATGYGINIVSAREAALAGVAGPGIIFWRVGLMFAALIAIVLWRRVPLSVPQGERRAIALLAGVSAMMGVSYISAVGFIPVTLAVVIFYTYPVLIILIAPFVTGETLSPLRLAIAALAFAGLVAVVGPAFEGLDPRGLALAGFAALCTTTQFFAANRARETPLLAKLFWLHVGMAPFAVAVCVLTTGIPGPATLALAPWAVAITIAGYVVGISLQMAALARIGAALAGLIFCLEPVVSTVGSLLYLSERLTSVQVAGGLAVLAAVAATVLAARRAEN